MFLLLTAFGTSDRPLVQIKTRFSVFICGFKKFFGENWHIKTGFLILYFFYRNFIMDSFDRDELIEDNEDE